MKTVSDIKYAVLEYLPWLEAPRILFVFDTAQEAEIEASNMNRLVMSGSTFQAAEVEYRYQFGLVADKIPKAFLPISW